jgi:hypothetical protein
MFPQSFNQAILIPELLDPGVDYDVPVDICAIGFEEIVDLNASNIVSARYAHLTPLFLLVTLVLS